MHSKYKAFHREVVFTLSPSRLMRFTWETLSSRKDFRMYSLHWEENVKWLSAGKHKCYPQTKLAQAQGPLLGEVVKTHLKFSFGKMSVRPPWKPWIRSVLPPFLGSKSWKHRGKKNHSFLLSCKSQLLFPGYQVTFRCKCRHRKATADIWGPMFSHCFQPH